MIDHRSNAVHAAVQLLKRRFGARAELAGIAPGRLNLIGEHTDYNDGFVMPMAIERYTAVTAASCSGTSFTIVSQGAEGEISVSADELLKPGESEARAHAEPRGSWKRYALGMLAQYCRRAADRGRALPAAVLAVAGNVPLGGGLSSSASFEIALGIALDALGQTEADEILAADIGRQTEHQFAEVPCGIMDQLIVRCGRAGHALLIDCRSRKTTHVAMPAAHQAVIAVVDSGVRHSLAASEYRVRRASCESAAKKLGVAALRDLAPSDLAPPRNLLMGGPLDDTEKRAVRHVVTENQRTLEAAEHLSRADHDSGALRRVGELMRASHASLRDDYQVSCPELDAIVGAVAAVPGVWGARMTGGGFGGSAIVLMQPAVESEVRAALDSAAKRIGGAPSRTGFAMFVTGAAPGAQILDRAELEAGHA